MCHFTITYLGMTGHGKYEYVLEFLEANEVMVADYGEITIDNFINYINLNAKNLVVTHWFHRIHLLNEVRTILMMYTLTNKNNCVYNIKYNYLMDLILTYGTEGSTWFNNNKLNAIPVGNPVFDPWFQDKLLSIDKNGIENKINTSNPTILYLPTSGEWSSIDKYLPKIVELSSDYNVLVKLHHLTMTQESNRLGKLLMNCPDLTVLGDNYDVLPLYKLANIVLVDSGTVFDALFLNKSVIMLDSCLTNNGRKVVNIKDSEFSVDNLDFVVSIDSVDILQKTIKSNLNRLNLMGNKIAKELFYSDDGCAGKRAAAAILDEKRYPAIPVLKKYERAIENIPEGETIEERDYFVNKYHHFPVRKPNFFKKVLNRLSICLLLIDF